MLTVTVHVTGLDAAQGRLSAIASRLQDFTGVMTSLAAKMVAFYENNVFDTSGVALGEAWEPLKESTLAQKEKSWPGRGILERSGTLRHGWVSEITPVSLFITNEVPYFPYHQLGTSEGRGRGHNIPARKMIGINADLEGLIRTEIEADVRAKIDGAVG